MHYYIKCMCSCVVSNYVSAVKCIGPFVTMILNTHLEYANVACMGA